VCRRLLRSLQFARIESVLAAGPCLQAPVRIKPIVAAWSGNKALSGSGDQQGHTD
jgi:hypothetical protein